MDTMKRCLMAGLFTAMVCAVPVRLLADVGVVQLYSTPDGEYQGILLEDDENDGVDRFAGLTFSVAAPGSAVRSITLGPDDARARDVSVDGKRRFLVATRLMSMWLRTQQELPDAFLAPDGWLTVTGFADGRVVVIDVASTIASQQATPGSALERQPRALFDDPLAATADFFSRPVPGPIVREYVHAERNRYVLAATQREKSNLDAGFPAGWTRTGHYFRALDADPASGRPTVPVCRYYLPPPLGDTHFHSAFAEECEAVAQTWPGAILESREAFRVALPEPSSGLCLPIIDAAEPENSIVTAPLYRVWNGLGDASHRFTTRVAEQEARVSDGWIAEGYGPHGTAMCVDTFDVGTVPMPKQRPKTPRRDDGR